jgi:hypothetical protein
VLPFNHSDREEGEEEKEGKKISCFLFLFYFVCSLSVVMGVDLVMI